MCLQCNFAVHFRMFLSLKCRCAWKFAGNYEWLHNLRMCWGSTLLKFATTSATCLRNFVCNYASYGFLFLCHTWEIHIILNINILSLSHTHTHSFSNVLGLLQLHPIASRLFFFFSQKTTGFG